jgi:flavorubredoxin
MGWIILIVILAAVGILHYLWLNQEQATPVEVQNPGGEAGTALIVFHPGRGSFHRRVIAGFAEGLTSAGWRVEVATASPQAPTDLDGYDLLVLGSPTYYFSPSAVIRRHLRRLGDLGGQRTVTIITGLGAGERSSAIMQDLVRGANGDLVKGLLYFRMRPNDEDNLVDAQQNRALAVEMATRAAQDIASA